MLRRHHEISAVSKDDFFAAFRMVAGGEGTITPEQVKDVLYEAMGAPPHDGPEVSESRGGECMTVKLCQADVEPAAPQLDDFLRGFEGMEKLNMETFEDVLDEYNTKHVTRPAKQYVSIQKLKDDRLKHRRCEGVSSRSLVLCAHPQRIRRASCIHVLWVLDASKSLTGDSCRRRSAREDARAHHHPDGARLGTRYLQVVPAIFLVLPSRAFCACAG